MLKSALDRSEGLLQQRREWWVAARRDERTAARCADVGRAASPLVEIGNVPCDPAVRADDEVGRVVAGLELRGRGEETAMERERVPRGIDRRTPARHVLGCELVREHWSVDRLGDGKPPRLDELTASETRRETSKPRVPAGDRVRVRKQQVGLFPPHHAVQQTPACDDFGRDRWPIPRSMSRSLPPVERHLDQSEMPECPFFALVRARTDVVEYEGQRNRADPAERRAEIVLVRRDLFDCLRTMTTVGSVRACSTTPPRNARLGPSARR